MNSDNCLKLRLVIYIFSGLCLFGSPALADVIPVKKEGGGGLLNRQIPFSFKENQSEPLPPVYFYSLMDDFTFGDTDKPLLAANKTYSSGLKERPESKSMRGRIKLDSNYFKGFVSDSRYMLTSPWRWDKSDWTTASIVAGITGVFFILDDEIREDVQGSRNSAMDDLSDIFERFGRGSFVVPVLSGFYLFGRFGENEKVERTALLAVESYLITGLFNEVLKLSIGRHRPRNGGDSDLFDNFDTGNRSFPSGHTSTAFAIATIVANEYEHVPLIAPLSYGIATLTGYSRINDNNHWASDVFFGAMLGYFTSKTILKLHSNKKGRHFTIYPRADRRGGGLFLSTQF